MFAASRLPYAAAVVVGALVVVLTSGCAPNASSVPLAAPPTESPEPLFASDEEALAAATAAYAEYAQAADASGRDPDSEKYYLSLTRGDAHKDDLEAQALYARNGWTSAGTTRFDSVSLQTRSNSALSSSVLSIYVCLDVSGTDVVDKSGASVLTDTRPLRIPLVVSFATRDTVGREILIEKSELWSGHNFC